MAALVNKLHLENSMLRAWLACAIAILVAGCATDRSFGTSPDVEVTDLTSLPMAEGTGTYSLQPFDSVEVKVLQDPALSGTYFIDTNGDLQFPLIGNVQASGLSTTQLTQRITSGLANGYIVNPDVSLRPTEMRDVSVSFGGEVTRPGNYPIGAASTLLRGVNAAGGLTDFAKTEDVLIMRNVDSRNYIGVYNLGAIERGNYPDPQLAPGDIIMIGDSPTQRRLASLLPYLSLLTTSVVLFDRVAR